jgi:hypothetical protein
MSKINSNSLLKGWVTEININAPQQLVWNKIVDFEAYKSWNPFMLEAKAELKVSSYICFLEDLKEFGQHWLTAKFLTIQEPNELVWQGNFRADFLFRVRHNFKLESIDEQQTRLIHSHKHTGILRPYLAYRGVFKVSRQGYILYNEALKKLCEEHYINKTVLS